MNTKTLTAYAEVKILWAKMCRAQGLSPDEKFVGGITNDMPFFSEYNEAMSRYQTAILEERATVEVLS